MKAAVLRRVGEPLVIEERAVPTPGPCDVVVRVDACGLCHTDLHVTRGDWPVEARLPVVPGHEIVGRIVATGADVAHVGVGNRVAVPWLAWACGRCRYCLTGDEALCRKRRNTGVDVDGGVAEYVRADADFVVRVPAAVHALDAACLTCAGVSAFRAVRTAGSAPAKLTAVFGIGGLGHMAVQYAALAGSTVVAVDLKDDKLAMAHNLGARHTVNATERDPAGAVQALGGADCAIVAAASGEAIDQGMLSLRPGATLVLVSLPPSATLSLPVFSAVRDGLRIVGSIGGSRLDLADVLRLHAEGATQVLHQARGLDQVNAALAELESESVPAKLVFEMR